MGQEPVVGVDAYRAAIEQHLNMLLAKYNTYTPIDSAEYQRCVAETCLLTRIRDVVLSIPAHDPVLRSETSALQIVYQTIDDHTACKWDLAERYPEAKRVIEAEAWTLVFMKQAIESRVALMRDGSAPGSSEDEKPRFVVRKDRRFFELRDLNRNVRLHSFSKEEKALEICELLNSGAER